TAEAGASDVFQRGFVTYANEAKQEMLGVPEALLIEHGAVSEEVAREMADGARRVASADWAVALTGVAGPGGGTADKPVGLVFAAVAGPDGTRVRRLQLFRDRALNRQLAAQAVLEMLRRDLARSAG
ncbi:MAG: CinA family protein, partial [Myxococcota bacterium]|nr:CinA family protein [Myxococcota bacterium]